MLLNCPATITAGISDAEPYLSSLESTSVAAIAARACKT